MSKQENQSYLPPNSPAIESYMGNAKGILVSDKTRTILENTAQQFNISGPIPDPYQLDYRGNPTPNHTRIHASDKLWELAFPEIVNSIHQARINRQQKTQE